MSHRVQPAGSLPDENIFHDRSDASACPPALATLNRCDSDQVTLCVVSDTEALLHKPIATPIPKLQLATLCLVRLVDPISFTQIFPYVNEMMQDLGIANTPSQVGFYSGLVDSIFAISQLSSIYHWAKLSDIIGRRPVILVGVVGVAFATLMFGLSHTFFAVIITRCLAGILAGNVATIHAVLGEITDASNQATAFPMYGLCWPLGSIIGPLIGGTFSHPAEKFTMFRDFALLRAHPYFLPCLISAAVSLGGAALGWYCLEETLPSKRRHLLGDGPSPDRIDTTQAYGTVNRTNAHQGEQESDTIRGDMRSSNNSDANIGMFALLAIPTVRALAASGFALSFLSGAFDVVFVLFCFSPISTGGLSYPAAQIGYALAIAGASAAMLQLLVMPSLLRRVDPVTAYKFCMKLWPIAYVALPLLNILARAGLQENKFEPDIEMLKPTYAVLVWLGIGVCLAFTRVANLAFSLSMILVKETSPSPGALGAANGLAQFAMCMARAISPAFVSALFAVSVDNRLLGSYFWVLVMVLFGVVGIKVTARVDLNRGKPTSGKTL